ncbi:MAG: prepilin-type N-terminal cleavage/methylation domain-containing protein [Planctomycetes bacterium]|nr:prepilin-type N-terminal cleavage/methylation domain-containing protein [Planctomycetota bacterium]
MLGKAHRLPSYRRIAAGFTLLELLVVVSIISLMMAMLTPSLRTAREHAKQVLCASRLRQWGVTFNCYAAENEGMWPHCDGLDRGPRPLDHPRLSPEDLADWHGWVDLLPPMIGMQAWRDYPRFKRPNERTFYQCAAAQPFDGEGVYSYRPDRDGYFSYAMNSCLELDKNAWPPPDGVGYPAPSFLDTAKIVTPERVIVLFDQLLDPRHGFDGNQVYRAAGQHCGSYPKSFSARHRKNGSELGGNVLYADGHAEWQESLWKKHWDIAQEVPPREDPDWYPYPAVKQAESKRQRRR